MPCVIVPSSVSFTKSWNLPGYLSVTPCKYSYKCLKRIYDTMNYATTFVANIFTICWYDRVGSKYAAAVRSKWEQRTFCRNNCINVVSWLYHATFHWYITRTWKQVSTQNMMNEHLVDLKKSAQLVSIRALWQSSWVLDQQSISQNRYFVQPMQWCGSSSLQLCNNCNSLCWHFRHCTNSN